eukprot:TRINITY_DN16432_c0_g1_i1.p1 TRINITY_DN16432_c0_g1~~TRINITY_DN16432_c0_g1_i1.p1  ORF type:complete len:426 (+),score=182.95 TRINITY_DN16432_c0_g1_i1:86-1363(+)
MSQHVFSKKHFGKPTWCEYCKKFIWGLGKQGYACKICTYPCHPKCKDKVLSNPDAHPCPGVKTNYSKKGDNGVVNNNEDPVQEEEEEEEQKKQLPKLVSQPSLSRFGDGTKEEVASATKIEDLYDIGAELGKGAFSVVKSCTYKETGEEYAVKVINKKNVQQDLHRLAIEMKVLRTVEHPNIIKLQEVFETEEMLYIVTEIVSGGELFDRIVSKGSYSEKDAQSLTRKFIEALEYLHDKNIVHRDLKPENLLLKSNANDTEVKLADFGLSKIMGAEVMLQTACGTPGYVAPEILQARPEGYGKEVDMWSVGVITYILLCGFPPFYNDNIPLLFESIMKADFDYPPEYWDHISDSAIDFIDSLLVAEPENRLTATQALDHPWLKADVSDNPINIGEKLGSYTELYREQSKVSGPSSCEDDNPLGFF